MLSSVARLTEFLIRCLCVLCMCAGVPLLCMLVYERGILSGSAAWLKNVVLGSIYYIFHVRTKAVGLQTGLRGQSAQYRATGRGLGLTPLTLLELYTSFATSHYHHALQLLLLLLLYFLLFSGEPLSTSLLKTYAILLAVFSWLCAPCLFNSTLCVSHDVWTSKCTEWQQVLLWCKRDFITASNPGSTVPVEQASWQNWVSISLIAHTLMRESFSVSLCVCFLCSLCELCCIRSG